MLERLNRGMSDPRPGKMSLQLSRARSPGGLPADFTKFKDAQGRFELAYPASWEMHRSGAVTVMSPQIGSFARVDPMHLSEHMWEEIQASLKEAGAKVKIESRRSGDPEVVRGQIRMSSRRFDWEARAFRVLGGSLVLSLGNVVDKRRGRAIERYENRVLSTIRRNFKVKARKR